MKIYMKEFRGDTTSVRLEEEMDPAAHDLEIGVMHFTEPVHVSAEAWKTDDDLTVQVHVEGSQTFPCSLCLEEFDKPFEKDLTLHYDVKGLDGVSIDSDVREEIILDHPIRILCREDCRGLCPTCGANLNQAPCDCQGEKPSSPL